MDVLSKIIGRFEAHIMAFFDSLPENVWRCLRLHRHALRSDLCLPVYGQLAIIILFLFVYQSTNIPWQVVVISLFMVLAYPLLAGLYGEGKGFLILIVSLISGGIILHKYMTLLITPVVLILFINFLIAVLTDSKNIYKRLPAISGVLLLTFLGFKYYFGLESPCVNPDDLYNLTLLKQHLDTDGSFHMSIINMILYNGFPSTGLHLTPLLLYHCLGHYAMAVFCLMMGLSIFNLYYFVFGFFIFPLIVISIVVLIRQLYPEARWSYFFFSLILFCSYSLGGTLGKLENPVQYGFGGIEPSLPLSIIFIFWICRNLGRRDIQWTIPLLIAFSFYAKSSTGATMFCAYLLALSFSDQSIISKFKNFATIALLSAIVLHFASEPDTANTMHFKFYSYYHDYILPIEKRRFLNALWVHYDIPIISMVILILLLLKDFIRIKTIWYHYRELILFAIGTLVAAICAGAFTFPNGSHSYFTKAAAYFFLPLGAISLEKIVFLRGNRFIKFLGCSILLVFLLNALLIMGERFEYYSKFHTSRHKVMADHISHYKADNLLSLRLDPSNPKFEEPAVIEPYFKALQYIKNNYSGRKYVVEIPSTETGFWNYTIYPYPRDWMPFYIPAISGKPAWNGYDYRFMKEKGCAWYKFGAYGYATYYRQKDNVDYKDSGYEGKLIIQTGKDKHIELIENNCNGAIKKVTME